MARSPSHTWGQIVGNALEDSVKRTLSAIADEHGLYLDSRGPRGTRDGVKVVWVDQLGNSHDLDYVIERDGTYDNIGEPLAFIEVAWRRYTKHSRNKVQEIQGAVSPVAERYIQSRPFLGAIVAGEFTAGALKQLRSHGFAVLHVPYTDVLKAFAAVGIDASSQEDTPVAIFERKLEQWDSLTPDARIRVGDLLLDRAKLDVNAFVGDLSRSLLRRIERIMVLPLAGTMTEFLVPEQASDFLSSLDSQTISEAPLNRIEIRVEYSNGDSMTAIHSTTRDAIQFLQSLP